MTGKTSLSRHDASMLLVAVIWGANFSANKFALGHAPPMVFAAARFILASGLLVLVVGAARTGPSFSGRTTALLAGLGVVGNTAYQAAFMFGLTTTTATNSALIMAALPTVVAVLGTAFGVERATPRLWLGIAVATAGVGLVIAARGIAFSVATIRGDLLILLAVVCWSAFTVGIRHFGRGLHPLRVAAITTVGGTPGLVLLAIPELGRTAWGQLPLAFWGALLYSSLFSIVLAYILWGYAVQSIGGSRTALYNCIVPLIAAAVAWVVLGERPMLVQGLGAALVIAGVLVSQSSPIPKSSPATAAVVPEP